MQPLPAGHDLAWRESGPASADRPSPPVSAGRSANTGSAPYDARYLPIARGTRTNGSISSPDARLRFHWIQRNKVAASAPTPYTRKFVIGSTLRPATCNPLNVQLEAWLIHGSNVPGSRSALGANSANLQPASDAPGTAVVPRHPTDIHSPNGGAGAAPVIRPGPLPTSRSKTHQALHKCS